MDNTFYYDNYNNLLVEIRWDDSNNQHTDNAPLYIGSVGNNNRRNYAWVSTATQGTAEVACYNFKLKFVYFGKTVRFLS